MVIYNSQGDVYKLRGPNPLMIQQQDWDKSKVRFINMFHKAEIVEDNKVPNVITLNPKSALKATSVSAKQFLDEIQTLPEPISVEPKQEPVDALQKLFDAKGVKYFCAPVIGLKEHTDSLYGETYQTMQYGDKYLFDALIFDQTDLELKFWCIRPITVNSIVYRKVKEGGERWWRVVDVSPKEGGQIISAIPSEISPDFS